MANKETPTVAYLRDLMTKYQTKDKKFKKYIEGLEGKDDAEIEGYDDPLLQRDLSVKFHWGHNHDFGNGWVKKGLMGDRHLHIIGSFVDQGFLPLDLEGKKVLDVGCWTGGSSLLLAAMGATVVGVEEVVKYASVVKYLSDFFEVDIDVCGISIYKSMSYDGFFDYVLFSGVLYHLSDPVVALRILYNSLKDNGTMLIESACNSERGMLCTYRGPTNVLGGVPGHRVGWNWFVPSIPALRQMCLDVGFESAITKMGGGESRVMVGCIKGKQKDMLRAGLSRGDLR